MIKAFPDLSEILGVITGYQRSKVLFTLVELEIPKLLNGKKLSAKQLSKRLKIHPLSMERFLNACVSVNLLQKEGDSFFNSGQIESYFGKTAEFDLSGIIKRHDKRSFAVWENLTESLRNWEYGGKSKKAPSEKDQGAEAMTEQHNLALLHGHVLAKAFDFSKFKNLLDMGGGTGAMSIALCKIYPKLQSIVFDLPANIKIAESFISKSRLSKRIKTVAGDFHKDKLPEGFDAALLANFMAVADARSNKKLLKQIYDKLPSKGVCLLSGWIIDDSHTAPQTSVLFCLEDICWGAPDVERSEGIYTSWLKETGFKKIDCKTYLYPTKMLYGRKP
jgi:hypothetical protein